MELVIAAASALISALVGACGGVAAIVKVSSHLDRRFDDTDDNIQALTHRYDVQRAKDIARIEMLEYQLGQTVELVNHKANRLENGLFQVSEYLKKNHDYSPRYTFPLERNGSE